MLSVLYLVLRMRRFFTIATVTKVTTTRAVRDVRTYNTEFLSFVAFFPDPEKKREIVVRNSTIKK